MLEKSRLLNVCAMGCVARSDLGIIRGVNRWWCCLERSRVRPAAFYCRTGARTSRCSRWRSFKDLEEHDPHAVIECKRIAGTNTHLCREYVVEGIDRFRTGKYGQNHAMGFMAGYLLADTAQDAVQGVNAYLTRASRTPEHLRPASRYCDGLFVGQSSLKIGSDAAHQAAPRVLCSTFP